MQQLFAATRNWVSFEGGDINLWCPSYDDDAKMALVRLFDTVFDYCQVDYARDSSGQIVPVMVSASGAGMVRVSARCAS